MTALPPVRDPEPPYAEVGPAGRWSWRVRVVHGVLTVDDAVVVGSRSRADRVARRRLARYAADEERLARWQHIIR